jgi:hypothetical protein
MVCWSAADLFHPGNRRWPHPMVHSMVRLARSGAAAGSQGVFPSRGSLHGSLRPVIA